METPPSLVGIIIISFWMGGWEVLPPSQGKRPGTALLWGAWKLAPRAPSVARSSLGPVFMIMRGRWATNLMGSLLCRWTPLASPP
jgi:hypothetical protein